MVKIIYSEQEVRFHSCKETVVKKIDTDNMSFADLEWIIIAIKQGTLFYIETIEYEEKDWKIIVNMLLREYKEPEQFKSPKT